MSLKLILGNAGAGKTHAVLTDILARAAKAPRDNFLVIVPEQFSMQTQDILTALHPGGTILNVDVLSFNRLAYRVFDEVGFKTRALLEDTGKGFVLQKIALDHEKELSALGTRLRKPGCIEEMKSVLSEMMQYDISVEQVEAMAELDLPGDYLKAKLKDIGLIYREFRHYLEDRFIVAEEVPDILCRLVEDSLTLQDAVIVFDGFTGFTPIQMKLLGRLMSMTREIIVTADMDKRPDPFAPMPEDDLFVMTGDMLKGLKRLCDETHTPIEPVTWIEPHDKSRFAGSETLSFLEGHIFRRHQASSEAVENISLHAYDDPAAEAEGCALEIARLVREEGLRYRDIAVLTGDMKTYGTAFRRVFAEKDIPCFIDEKKTLLRNPFVECVRAALAACADGYSYDSVFRLLKTGMTDIEPALINQMENYVMAVGIRGKKSWREPWHRLSKEIGGHLPIFSLKEADQCEQTADLKLAMDRMARLNKGREAVIAILDPLSEVLADRGAVVQDKAAAIYRFCEALKCQEKLKAKEDIFAEEGRGDLVGEYSQIYRKVMEVLEKLVSVLGDQKLSQTDIQALMDGALAEFKLGLIPLGTDQVMVGDMERSRLKDIKVLFFVGVNEGLVPKAPAEGGLLSEIDREALDGAGVSLKPLPRKQVFIQNFYLYLALTKASERLNISFSKGDGKGEERRPAYLIGRILRLFPQLDIRPDEHSLIDRIETKAEGARLLAEGLRNLRTGVPADDWFELYSRMGRDPEFADRLALMLEAAAGRRPEDAISREAARALYGRRLRNSATRLERFAGCAFAHFVQFGLRLQERETFELSSLDRGNVLHKALESFGRRLQAEGIDWKNLTDAKERDALAETVVRETCANRAIYHENARNEFEVSRLVRHMKVTVWAIQQQLAAGDFELAELEKNFDDVLKSRHFRLPDGSEMTITGVIDRIDTYDEGDVRYIKIVDYKSSMKEFDLNQVYHGLQLQLVLYMNAAVEAAKQEGKIPVVAGILYHGIKDPEVTYQKAPTQELVEQERLKALKESGLCAAEMEIARHLDRQLPETERSLVMPLGKNGRGQKDKATRVADSAQFAVLGRFAERKAVEIGTRIMAGEATVSPYVMGKGNDMKTPCTYCPYHDICGFDEHQNAYEYRRLTKCEDEEIFKRMEAENENSD
ncbi:MAG: PD-(D/E)XK nuclease family protein [Lachnospiraceae bacterium]|nr:PD-(D/E)XK nuclease family protein [Lachnospiraceae bacterium]